MNANQPNADYGIHLSGVECVCVCRDEALLHFALIYLFSLSTVACLSYVRGFKNGAASTLSIDAFTVALIDDDGRLMVGRIDQPVAICAIDFRLVEPYGASSLN